MEFALSRPPPISPAKRIVLWRDDGLFIAMIAAMAAAAVVAHGKINPILRFMFLLSGNKTQSRGTRNIIVAKITVRTLVLTNKYEYYYLSCR